MNATSMPIFADAKLHPDSRSAGQLSKAAPPRRIVVISSLTTSLVNFRLELLRSMVAAGHTVTATGPEDDPKTKAILAEIGVRFVCVPMSRVGLNPVADLKTLLALLRLFRRLQPDLILPYTMKPIIYGGLAARLAGVPSRCFLVTGLGHVFSNAALATVKGRLVHWLSIRLYRYAFSGARVIFAYNRADAADLVDNTLLGAHTALKLVPGTGVDLDRYAFRKPRSDKAVFLLVARLLKDKGINEFVEAARLVKKIFPDAEFRLLGHFEPNPRAGISPDDIRRWTDEGTITYLGTTDDVRPNLTDCNVFVLPSYYREGIPRSILEAMSVGRAIITTALPGCRDTIDEGRNGILIEPRSASALADAMAAMAGDLSRTQRMGEASREIAESKFDVHAVNRVLMESMNI